MEQREIWEETNGYIGKLIEERVKGCGQGNVKWRYKGKESWTDDTKINGLGWRKERLATALLTQERTSLQRARWNQSSKIIQDSISLLVSISLFPVFFVSRFSVKRDHWCLSSRIGISLDSYLKCQSRTEILRRCIERNRPVIIFFEINIIIY